MSDSKPRTGLKILSFCLPVVGIIQFFKEKDVIVGKSYLKWAVNGLVAHQIIIGIIGITFGIIELWL